MCIYVSYVKVVEMLLLCCVVSFKCSHNNTYYAILLNTIETIFYHTIFFIFFFPLNTYNINILLINICLNIIKICNFGNLLPYFLLKLISKV